jgi:hypothetical protein
MRLHDSDQQYTCSVWEFRALRPRVGGVLTQNTVFVGHLPSGSLSELVQLPRWQYGAPIANTFGRAEALVGAVL